MHIANVFVLCKRGQGRVQTCCLAFKHFWSVSGAILSWRREHFLPLHGALWASLLQRRAFNEPRGPEWISQSVVQTEAEAALGLCKFPAGSLSLGTVSRSFICCKNLWKFFFFKKEKNSYWQVQLTFEVATESIHGSWCLRRLCSSPHLVKQK